MDQEYFIFVLNFRSSYACLLLTSYFTFLTSLSLSLELQSFKPVNKALYWVSWFIVLNDCGAQGRNSELCSLQKCPCRVRCSRDAVPFAGPLSVAFA